MKFYIYFNEYFVKSHKFKKELTENIKKQVEGFPPPALF
ncbi:hypothetical protein BAOM_4664 [Peribacillus asahii]|uniref:Uncharacterized protein n=1 Tax=Peribacillus asahii TaxID=228899 RepID=A0A3T0KY47_9BACI|nr:hypothetical protein BAOM_4664 [Peribacillus asahii]